MSNLIVLEIKSTCCVLKDLYTIDNIFNNNFYRRYVEYQILDMICATSWSVILDIIFNTCWSIVLRGWGGGSQHELPSHLGPENYNLCTPCATLWRHVPHRYGMALARVVVFVWRPERWVVMGPGRPLQGQALPLKLLQRRRRSGVV